MLILALVIVHLIIIHEKGSSNPINSKTNHEKMKFHPSQTIKDMTPIVTLFVILITINSIFPNYLGDVENFNIANPLIAPIHIQPE